MLNRLFFIFLLSFFVCQIAVADELTNEKYNDIKRLLTVTGAAKITEQIAIATSQQMFQLMKETNPDIPERVFTVINRELNVLFSEKIAASDGLMDKIIPVYDKYFTHQEILDVLSFYQTPTGIKSISVLPMVATESMMAGQRWGESLAPEINRRLTVALEQEGLNKSSSSSPSIEAPVTTQQKIKMLEESVVSDPKSRNAWVELGNAYFDEQLPTKAIEAYAKGLELNPNDPNVLNDQGVMYRQLGSFEKAIVNFTKANQLDPRNLQSLYNLGIIYCHDLKDYAKAKKAWGKYLDINPTGESADRIREEIRWMESLPQ